MSDPRETSYYVDPTKRSIVLPGVAADRFYNLSVRGYRRVDKDIAASGVIFSEMTAAKSWRYRPSETVAFAGDITGTIRGVATSQVIADLNAIVDDGILSRPEKQATVLLWSNLHSQWDAASSKANQLGGLESYVGATAAAITALDGYLTTLRPAWNDLGVDTPIDAQKMQNAFATAQASLADLIAMNIDRASELASWSNIRDDDGKKPEPGATVGAVIGVDVKHPDGTIFVPGATDVDMDAVRAEIERGFNEAKADLDRDVQSAVGEAAAARGDAATARREAASAGSDAALARSDLATEVERAKGQEGTLSTRVSTAQGTADAAQTAITTETTQRADADKALSSRTDTVEAKLAGTTESAILARIRTEETTRASAVEAVAARATVLESSTRSTGNLLPNSDLATMDGWTIGSNLVGASVPRIRNDDDYWIPRGESVMYVDRPGVGTNPTNYVEVLSALFAVQPGTCVQFYARTASHRCTTWVSLFFYSADGSWHSYAGEHTGARNGNGGPDLNQWDHTGSLAFKIPAGAVTARMVWRMYDVAEGQANGVAWMFRPFVGTVREGQTEWLPYSPGSSKPQTIGSNAKIAEEATTRSNADSALSNRVTTTEAKLSGTEDSVLAARIRTEETARTNNDSALASRATSIESRVTRAEGFSNGDLVRKGSFEDGKPGDWTNGVSPIRPADYGQTVPPTGQWAILMRGVRDSYESNTWIEGAWGGRKLRVTGYASCQFSPRPSSVGVNVRRANGELTWIGVRAAESYVAGYNRFDQPITLPADAVAIRPWLQCDGDAAETPNMEVRLHSLSIRDVTVAEQAIARINEEATTRSNSDSALAGRSSTLESQMGGTATSALKTLIDDNRRNLAQVGWWKKGGVQWVTNGGQRNEIVEFPHGNNFSGLPMPDGSSGDAWLCQADAGGHNAGGWDVGQLAPLDPDKTYRFIVPIAQLGGAGPRTSYWGVNGVAYLNTADPQPNPYFAVASSEAVKTDKWYLYVGYVFPRNSIGKSHAGAGVYDMETGEQVTGGQNFTFMPDGRTLTHRAYQFYAYNGAYQAFGRPLVELVDGSETPFPVLSTYSRKMLARITTEETTRSNADSALSNRAATLEAQISGTQDSVLAARIRTEETARTNNDSALANRATTLEAQISGSQDSVLAARIRAEETARTTADSAMATRATALEARSSGGGNLLTATTMIDHTGWVTGSHAGTYEGSVINLAGDPWHPVNENTFGVREVGRNADGAYFDWQSERVSVIGGGWYQAFAWCAAHRCNVSAHIAWYDAAGVIIAYSAAPETWPASGGQGQSDYTQVGVKSVQAPANAKTATFAVRKLATFITQGDSYMWWYRPYLGEARSGQTEWNPFSHGSGRAAISSALAKITEEATVRADANSAIARRTATLESKTGSLESRTGIVETAVTDAKTKLAAARLELSAVSPGGRASITLRSDNNSGAGVDVVGDVTFKGKMDIEENVGGNIIRISSSKGFQMIAPNGVVFIDLGI